MRSTHGALLVVLLLSAHSWSGASERSKETVEFVGTTPCGPAARTFLEGIPPSEPCDAVTWRLRLVSPGRAPSTWTLLAGYEVPTPGRPGHIEAGPRVSLEGTWEISNGTRARSSARTYLLKTGRPERSFRLTLIGDDLLHLLAEDSSLFVGNGGWSYTLSRADRAEKSGSDAPPPDLSYAISPRATGPVFGVFEGRTPCRGMTRALNLPDIPGCSKVKWRVTLDQEPRSLAPTTYKVEGMLHRKKAREGTWTIVRGPSESAPVVYRLEATSTEPALFLMKGDDNVLFFVDPQLRPMIGNAEFSYTLNRVPTS